MRFDFYDRAAAVRYAHRWAFGRNPGYADFGPLGGDCTNFVSQCLFAGGGVMNFTPTFGWYYLDLDHRAPAWTGVPYLWNFLTREERSEGPVGRPCGLGELLPGDVVQLSFDGQTYRHTQLVVAAGRPALPGTVLIAAHSDDADWRPLASYPARRARCLHIAGVLRP